MTARKADLRAVGPDEKPPSTQKKPQSVAQAVASGSRRDVLVAMQERIATAVSDPKCPPRDLSSLTRRLGDITEQIEAIDLRAKEEGEDAANLLGDEEWDAEAL